MLVFFSHYDTTIRRDVRATHSEKPLRRYTAQASAQHAVCNDADS